MSERINLIKDYESGDFGISELAQQYQVSRKTIYKWLERFERERLDRLGGPVPGP